MQITISARHGQLSDDAQSRIAEKAQKLLQIFERLTMIEVTVDLKNEVRVVEVQVEAEHKHDMIAKVEGREEVLALVEKVLQKMGAQLRRYKEKIQSRRGTPSTGHVAGPSEAEEPEQE